MKITADSENNRLFRDRYHNLEYIQTMECLKRYLPSKGKILDIGGGTGVYAFELYRAGYDVVLLDVSKEIIDKAKCNFKKVFNEKFDNNVEFILADAQNIDIFESNSFDAILCLGGVMSIINSDIERTELINKIINIGKNNSIFIVSILGYIALLRTLLLKYSHKLSDRDLLETILTKKQCSVGNENEMWQFFRADEFESYLYKFPILIKDVIGCESLSSGLHSHTNDMEKDSWDNWLSLLKVFSKDKTVIDMSEHILYICQIMNKISIAD